MYPWASRPVVVAALLLLAMRRPALFTRGTRILDAALIAVLVVIAFQLLPLPIAIHDALSPASAGYRATLALEPGPPPAWLPLSVVPSATADSLGIVATAVALFWLTRESLRARGTRLLVRSIAWMGLGAAVIALVVPAIVTNHKIYGFWEPISPLTDSAGPIISRNHLAAWFVLAIAIAGGYLVAHGRAHWRKGRSSTGHRILSDTRAFWLLGSVVLMVTSLLVTQSRGGVIGFAVALAVALVLGWRVLGVAGRAGLLVYAVGLVVAASFLTNTNGVAMKFDRTLSDSWGGRPEIWRLSYDLFARYWRTGTGLGTFDVAMSVYQPTPRVFLINHAHNQYLNALAEGGVMLAIPVLIVMLAFAVLVARRLRSDRSTLLFVRAGAAAGIVGLATHSLWESPLLTPAVLFLLAVAGGIAAAVPHEDETI